MAICLFEYATYFGIKKINPSLAIEGLGMFKSLLNGFEKIMKVNTSISDDICLFKQYPRKCRFEDILEKSEYALVIAPESEKELYNLTKKAEKYCNNLGSSSKAIRIAGDKWLSYKRLKSFMPKTEIFKGSTKLDFPLIAKPRNGCGCEGIIMIKKEKDLNKVPNGYILQEFVEGKPYSASFIIGDEITRISTQTQEIRNFKYRGARIPVEIEDYILEEALSKIKGLFGYVGIDFIVGEEGIRIIEINARATTPIIAFKHVYGINVSELIFNNYYREEIPKIKSKNKIIIKKRYGKGNFISLGGYSISIEAGK
ncbi:MAG: ATP-utilizing protein [Thermoplasmata archaeon]|nr:MAG: ATP-utilizing protein [Thermoplasmata archaeon]